MGEIRIEKPQCPAYSFFPCSILKLVEKLYWQWDLMNGTLQNLLLQIISLLIFSYHPLYARKCLPMLIDPCTHPKKLYSEERKNDHSNLTTGIEIRVICVMYESSRKENCFSRFSSKSFCSFQHFMKGCEKQMTFLEEWLENTTKLY